MTTKRPTPRVFLGAMALALWSMAFVGCAIEQGVEQSAASNRETRQSQRFFDGEDRPLREGLSGAGATLSKVTDANLSYRRRLIYPDASLVGMDALQMFYAVGEPDRYVIDGNAEIWHIRQYSGSEQSTVSSAGGQYPVDCVWRVLLIRNDSGTDSGTESGTLRVSHIEKSGNTDSCSSGRRYSMLSLPVYGTREG